MDCPNFNKPILSSGYTIVCVSPVYESPVTTAAIKVGKTEISRRPRG